MWWKQHKWHVILPAAVVLLLAAAFWLGGSPDPAPTSPKRPALSSAPAPSPAPAQKRQAPASSPSPKAPKSTSKPAPTVSPVPEATPLPEMEQPTAQPTADREPDHSQADPSPADDPEPVEPGNVEITDEPHTCTISISCETILSHMDALDSDKAELVPADGWILQPTAVTFYQGESVFNVLQRTCKQQGIPLEFEATPAYASSYIEGIYNLYQYDCGDLSGWMYHVNGWFPNYGCNRYQLREGDVICWEYTCDLGADIGKAVD